MLKGFSENYLGHFPLFIPPVTEQAIPPTPIPSGNPLGYQDLRYGMSPQIEDLPYHHPHCPPIDPLLPKGTPMTFQQLKQLLYQQRLCAILKHESLLAKFGFAT